MDKNRVIVVQNINITISEKNFDDYICITDIAKAIFKHALELVSQGVQML